MTSVKVRSDVHVSLLLSNTNRSDKALPNRESTISVESFFSKRLLWAEPKATIKDINPLFVMASFGRTFLKGLLT